MLQLRWLHLFFRIFLLLLIILFIMPIIINNWFFHLSDSLYPRGNAVLVYKNYSAGYGFLTELAWKIRNLILFM